MLWIVTAGIKVGDGGGAELYRGWTEGVRESSGERSGSFGKCRRTAGN